jgi:hypothetical protein
MKTNFYPLFFGFIFSFAHCFCQQDNKTNAESLSQIALSQKLRQQAQVPTGTSSDWYAEAMKSIQKREYQFNKFDDQNKFSAFNRKQNLAFVVSENGYEVKRFNPANNKEFNWHVDFASASISRSNGNKMTGDKNAISVDDNQLSYTSSSLKIEYFNNEEGFRQNFIVKTKPSGKGNLEVLISVNTDLHLQQINNSKIVFCQNNQKKSTQLIYEDLKVWDADQKQLSAHMELKNNHEIALVVNDADAKYPVTIDPLNKTPDWQGSGNGLLFPLLNDLTAQVMYGFSVSTAGDVNGDGIDDIIIGAPAYVQIASVSGGTFNPIAVGAAFLYYGHRPGGPSTSPDEVMQPTTTAGALFGFSVSTAGDVNGDGYADIIIGAPGDQASVKVALLTLTAKLGRAYIFYGGPSGAFDGNVNTLPTVSATLQLSASDLTSNILNLSSIIGTVVNPLYGFSVSSAGDVNGDGKADVLVGAPAYIDLTTLNTTGRVDVYHGSSSGVASTPNRVIKGGLLNGLFGYSVNKAGDVNNDHYDDIIIGAPASLSVLSVGSAYIFHGSSTGITATTASAANKNLQAPGLLNQTLFGYSVSYAGDVNGDGYADVIVGEPLSLEQTLSLQLVAVGKAHIYYGSSSGISSSGATDLTSPRSPSVLGLVQGNLLFGFSVSAAGDVNCDGLADVIVGEPGGTAVSLFTGPLGIVNTNALSGRAYVYFGSYSKPSNTPSWYLEDTNSSLTVANLIGFSVSRAGDVNGDGKADVLIGAPNGTLDLGTTLTGIIGNALNYVTVNSVGSAYAFFGCFSSNPTNLTLPVQLLSFEAAPQNGIVLTNWAISDAVNLNHFELQRSTDGIYFETIAIVFYDASPSFSSSYQVKDMSPVKGMDYYKLKMIDNDGKISYSQTEPVEINSTSVSSISVMPNPVVSSSFKMQFKNMNQGIYEVMISDITGKNVYTKNIELNASQTEQLFQKTSSMITGIYIVTVTNRNNNTRQSFKLIVQ